MEYKRPRAAAMTEDLSDPSQTLVIIGNGMVGWKLCQRMVEYGANDEIRIIVFGDEPHPAYDRVHLTEYFAGRPPSTFSLAPTTWYEHSGIELFTDDPIVEVDREQSVVRSRSGRTVEYNRLVFATGSRPFVPPIEGSDLAGVFVYRTLDDVCDIEEYACDPATLKSAAVIGGGLLGLEAAKAVFDLELDVHVVEVSPWLMPRQLDAEGGAVLRDKVERMGVKIRCGKKLLRIEEVSLAPSGGSYRIAANQPPADEARPTTGLRLRFDDGETLIVGLVIFAAGVRPRGELAKAAGLQTAGNGGIVVDDTLQAIDRTSRKPDEQIFAIGECASHQGTTYGLVLPGYQMVDVLAVNLLGGERKFEGADTSAKLKLMGVTVAALGEHEGDQRLGGTAVVFNGGGVYRKLVIRNGRLIGAVTVGEWENLDRIRELLKSPLPMSFWDMRRFRGTGNLWPKSESSPVAEWPPAAIVCGCLQVTRGALSLAIAGGCQSLEDLGTRTSAGTLCGSCKPLLSEMLGLDGPVSVFEPMPPSWREGPRSVRRGDGGPRSRRGEGPRSVRRGDLTPSSQLDSSQRTPSVVPSSTLIDEAPCSRRDGVPSSLETLAPPSRRVSITITDRPPELPGALARVFSPVMPAPVDDDADIEPGPMSVRGQMIRSRDDDDAGPVSMRSGTFSTRTSVDMPPPSTLRSSIPPPPLPAAVRADVYFQARAYAEEAPAARRGVALAASMSEAGTELSLPGEDTLVETEPPREDAPTPPTGIEIAPRSGRASRAPVLAGEATPTPPTGVAVVVPRTPRQTAETPPAGIALIGLGGEALPPVETKTPATGLVLGLASSQRAVEGPIRRTTPPAGSVRVASIPPPSSSRLDLLLALATEAPTSSVPPTSRPVSSGTILPPSTRVAIVAADFDTLPKIEPLPPIESPYFAASDDPPSSAKRLSAASDEFSERKESSSASMSRVSLISMVDESEIADMLSFPRDSFLPGLPGDRAPMSRRSWVPPRRLSISPDMLHASAIGAPRTSMVPPIQAPPERGRKILLVASVMAISSVLVLALAPSIPPSRSIHRMFFDTFLRVGVAKQATGFALVALCVLSLGVSLRKRWKRFRTSDVPVFRAVHAALGAASMLLFFLHTGLSAGSRINFVLTVDFVAVMVLGALAGTVFAVSSRWSPVAARDRRLRVSFVHLLLTWPLPILIALHVLAVYYY